MLAKLHTFSLLGIEAIPVDVEVDISAAATPKTILVGLPEAAVKESTHRVERAILPDRAAAGNRHSEFHLIFAAARGFAQQRYSGDGHPVDPVHPVFPCCRKMGWRVVSHSDFRHS